MTGNLYDIDELPGVRVEDKRGRELTYQAEADLMHANPGKYVPIKSFEFESKARQCAYAIRNGSLAAFWFGLNTMSRYGRNPDVDAVIRRVGDRYTVFAAYVPKEA